MSCESDKTAQDVVTSVGNAWVVGRSKSYQGRVYYFNTLTGKSAWNLSEDEMEKMKRKQNMNQTVTLTENCPEPKEPPEDHHYSSKVVPPATPSKIYNKQIINNQITRPPYVPQFATASCSNFVIPSSQVGFNPSVWSIPPTHILIAPSMSPVINHLDSNTKFVSHSSSPSAGPSNVRKQWNSNVASNYFKNQRFSHRGNSNKRRFMQKRGGPYNNNRNWRKHNDRISQDLRQILTAKRNLQDYCDNKYQGTAEQKEENCTTPEDDTSANTTKTNDAVGEPQENLYPSDIDEEWLEAHTHYEGANPTLDVSALSKLVSKDGQSEYWYIVVDSSILLNSLDFLLVLLNSDKNCLLIVQQGTITALRQATELGGTRLKKRSRRALCFLSQQISSECAFVDDQNENKETGENKALTCCINMSEQKQHVVLLTNDEELSQHKNKVSFPIFSVDELKKFLQIKHADVQVQFPEPEELSITISNDVTDEVVVKMSPTDTRAEAICFDKDDGILSDTLETSNIPMKITVDAEVQTDFTNQRNSELTSPIVSNIDDTPQEFTTETVSKQTNDSFKTSSDTILAKKKEIRLKRPTQVNETKESQCNNKLGETKEKHFKWHRRRNFVKSSAASSLSDNTNNQLQENKATECDKESSSEYYNELPMRTTDGNIYGSDVVENSETSSCIISRPNLDERVTIDETSISGDISNSISNADSESFTGLTHGYAAYSYSEDKQSKNVMFEITSKFMEDHLRRNSDEWISRFLQIMEEVLSQMLRQDPPFVNAAMPPPWTAPEAVECIKKKFSKHMDVVDACTKLSDLFFKLSDANGNVNRNMLPAHFMEMYSFGVYLVDSLVNVQDNEDLQTATESLSNLLSDIQDPNMDIIHNDSFTENMNDLSLNITNITCGSDKPTRSCNVDVGSPKVTNNVPSQIVSDASTPKSDSSRKRYSLRSDKNKLPLEEPQPQEVKFIRKIDTQCAFFTCLQLQKNVNNRKSINDELDQEQIVNENNLCNVIQPDMSGVENERKHEAQEDANKTEPKIIRNFTRCLEFENKLKNKPRQELDLDQLDYYENYNDSDIENGDLDDDYNYGVGFSEDNDFYRHKISEEQQSNAAVQNCNENEQSLSSDCSDRASFKWFIAAVWREIKLILSHVHTFCENTIQYLQESDQLSLTKHIEIRDQSKKALKDLDNLCKALESDQVTGSGVREILRYFGIEMSEDIILDDEQQIKYREIVTKCTEQANILLKSLSLIIVAINN